MVKFDGRHFFSVQNGREWRSNVRDARACLGKARLQKKQILSLLLIICVSLCAFALNVPQLTGPVVDNAGIINSTDEQNLNKTLSALSNQTGIQIAVLTISSLNGESLESYSMQVAEKWQLGQKGEDNGALLLVSLNDRSLRIESGYGLEGELTDTKAGMIIRNVITPRFKEGNYSKGIVQGVSAMIQTVAPEFEVASEKIDYSTNDDDDFLDAIIPFVIFMLFTLIPVFGNKRKRHRRGYNNSTLNTLIAAKILSDAINSSTRKSSNHDIFGGSGFGGSGFGGSGFGGFSGGGGGFGGGGASGKW